MSSKNWCKRPLRKNKDFSKRLNESIELRKSSKNDKSKFCDILNKKWKVFRVSPMYNFSSEKLKLYEKFLNEEMNAKKESTSNSSYKSKVTLIKDLRFKNECPEALRVEVVKDDIEMTYVGNFISWSNKKTDAKDFISLPVLLVEGKPNELYKVHASLSKLFDCDIQPVKFSFYALVTFFVKLLETLRPGIDVSKEEIILEYKIPECGDDDKIQFSLFLEPTIIVLAKVMDDLYEKHQGITTTQIIQEFYNKLLNHFYQIYQVDLTFAELGMVTFPDALLTSSGQVKMSNENAAISTLNILEYFTPLEAILNVF